MVGNSDAAVTPLDPELENIVSDKRKKTGSAFAVAQRLGRSLMLPIATLPAAGLLLRLGQADMLGADGLAETLPWLQPVADVFAAAGGAIFDNLPLIFAVGVAVERTVKLRLVDASGQRNGGIQTAFDGILS